MVSHGDPLWAGEVWTLPCAGDDKRYYDLQSTAPALTNHCVPGRTRLRWNQYLSS